MMATMVAEMAVLLLAWLNLDTYELELELDLEYLTEVMERNTQVKRAMMAIQITMTDAVAAVQ